MIKEYLQDCVERLEELSITKEQINSLKRSKLSMDILYPDNNERISKFKLNLIQRERNLMNYYNFIKFWWMFRL